MSDGQLTLAEMKTALQRYGFNEEDPLTIWLNAAMHDLESEMDWPWLEVLVATQTVASGQSALVLPEHALKVIMVRDITNKRKLQYLNRHKFARDIVDPTEKGKAEFYTLVGTTQVRLYPVLEASTEYEIIYQATTPNLAAGTDKPTTGGNEWPGMTSYPIVQRAVSLALQAENEEERAKAAQSQYEESLKRLKGKFGERELDEPETVEDVMGYGSRYGY